jgi:hypothetical protein
VSLQRSLDHRGLAGDALRVEAGAGAGQLLRRAAREMAGERGRGRGVADAHLAADQDRDAIRGGSSRQLAAGGDRRQRLLAGQRGLVREVRARLQAGVDDVQPRRVGVDAGVDAHELGLRLLGEHGHGAAAVEERGEHLPRHLGRERTHVFGGDAVVGGGDDDAGADLRAGFAGHAGEPDRQLLEAPEAAGRLHELRLPSAGSVHRGVVKWPDLRIHGRGTLPHGPAICSAAPTAKARGSR